MSEFNLSGSLIQETYQRLVQVGSGSLMDGTGSALPISISGSDILLTGSLNVSQSITASNANITNFTSSNGSITNLNSTNITASGTVSASAIVTPSLKVTGSGEFQGSLTFNAVAFTATEVATHAGSHVWGTNTGSSHYYTGSITASNNIHATNFYGNGSGLTNITASYVAGTSIVGSVDSALTASKMPFSGLTGTATTWNQSTTGNAATATKIGSIENEDIVLLNATQSLTNKTLVEPTISNMVNCTFPTLNQSTTGNAATATKIASITNSNIVQLTDIQTLTNKTLTSPTFSSPTLGTPASGDLTNCTFPTLNQNTTGTANNANTASFITGSGVKGVVANATSASVATTALTASYVTAGNIDGTVENASTASIATSATNADTASFVAGTNVDGNVAGADQAANADTVDNKHANEFTLDYVVGNGASTSTAVTFSGGITGSLTGTSTGLSESPTIAVTAVTASAGFSGNGTNLTNLPVQSQENFTSAFKTKLEGIASQSNNYILTASNASTLGGVKIGYATTASKDYPVQLASDKMYVSVPWTDNNTEYSVGDNGLTQNNFTNAFKNKLNAITQSTETTDSVTFATASVSKLTVNGSATMTGSLVFNGVSFTETVVNTTTGSFVWGTDSTSSHYFTGSITASNNIVATNFYGNGTGLTNLPSQTDENFTTTFKTTLESVEDNATADQTGAEIKSALFAESDTNNFTDTLKTKLEGIAETTQSTNTSDNVQFAEITASSIKATGTISSSGTISASGFYLNGVEFTGSSTATIDLSAVTQSIVPSGSTYNLGSSTNKWNEVYATNTFFGGVHEINLETKDIGKLPEGTILVHSSKGLVPCTSEGDYLVMGVSSPGTDYPIILGAEPVLVHGPISAGDFITTSKTPGYGKAIKPTDVYTKNYLGKIIAQSLEDSEGGLIKAMIRKM